MIRLGLSGVRRSIRTRRFWTPMVFSLETRTLLTTGRVLPIASGANPIGQAVIQFDQPVTGFDLGDLSLTRDGGPNLLTGRETLITDDEITWTLDGLESLTERPGNYILTISPRGVGATLHSAGHADLDMRLNRGVWTLGAILEDHDHDDHHDHDHHDHDHHDHERILPSDQVVFFAGPIARTPRPSDVAFDFIGVEAGATYWRLPQTDNPNLPFLGISTEGMTAEAVGSYVETDPRVKPVSITLVSDDGETGFTATSGWLTQIGQGFNGSLLAIEAGDGSQTVEWVFNVTPGLQRIALTWVADFTAAPNARFQIFDGSIPLGVEFVDQTRSPASINDRGAMWHELTGPFNVTSGVLRVVLSNDAQAGSIVLADAVRVESVPEASAFPWVSFQVVQVNGPGEFSIWTSSDDGPILWVSTLDGLDETDRFLLLSGTHRHVNWGFSQPGLYEVIVTASARDPLTGQTIVSAPFTYLFGVESESGFGVFDLTGAPITQAVPARFTITDPTPAPAPIVAIDPIPSGRNAPQQATIRFDRPVRGLSLADLSLTRDGGPNLLTGSENLTSTDGGRTWTLSGLAPLTTIPGAYALSVVQTGLGRRVLDQVHLDFEVELEDGELELKIHDDTNDVVFKPDAALIFVGPMALTTRPADAAFDFIGVQPGATYWRLPQNANPNLVFPGFSTEDLPTGAVGSYVETDSRVISTAQPWVTFQVVGVDGPGQFSIWASGDEGPLVWVSTANGLNEDDKVIVPSGTHVHYNLGFTAPGVYRVIFQASFLDAEGRRVVSEPTAFVFGVETTTGFPVVDIQTSVPLAAGATTEFTIISTPPPPPPSTTVLERVVALFGNRRADIFNRVQNPQGVSTLPWTATRGLELTFDRPLVNPEAATVSLVDPLGRSVTLNTISFDAAFQTMTMTTPIWRLDGLYTLTITHSALVSGSAVFQTNLLRGDVNGDGVVNQRDRQVLQRAIRRPPLAMNPLMRTRADLNGQGGVNRRDLATLNALLANRNRPRPVAARWDLSPTSRFVPAFQRRG